MSKNIKIKPNDNYLGIPRKEIPWFPAIDYNKCNTCKICMEYCKIGVYSFDPDKNKVFVKNPYNCVVSCNGCEDKCPNSAITFPSTKVIDDVRKKYGV